MNEWEKKMVRIAYLDEKEEEEEKENNSKRTY